MPANARTVGIIAATDWEARPLISALHLKSVSGPALQSAGLGVYEGAFDGGRLLLSVCGIGQDRARKAAVAMARHSALQQKPALIISCGYGGALRPGMRAGDLALDEPRSDGSFLDSIKRIAQIQNLRVHEGNFWSGTQALLTGANKLRAGRDANAILAEMEGNAIWEVCQDAGIPFGAIRAVSDEAEQDLPHAALSIDNDGRLTPRFWLDLLTRPQDWPSLGRMYGSARKADRALAGVFTAFFQRLSIDGGLHVRP